MGEKGAAMDRKYQFTLETEEYLQFLRYQYSTGKGSRGKKLWLMTSLPALVICTMIFFGLYRSALWVTAAVAAMVVWVVYGAPGLWRRYVNRKIDQRFLDRLSVKGFEEVTLEFGPDQVRSRSSGGRFAIPYGKLSLVQPLPEMLVLGDGTEKTLLLPYRIFSDQEEIQTFLRELETARAKASVSV